VSVQCSNIFQ